MYETNNADQTTSEEKPNIFQIVASATNDIVTPANFLSATGLALTVHGAAHITEGAGVAEIGVGRALDFVDGWIARKTNTASETGELIDSSFDKLAMLSLVIQSDRKKIVSRPLLAGIVAVNVTNAAISSFDKFNIDSSDGVHSTWAGKRGYALQNLGIGASILGSSLEKRLPATGRTVRGAGTILGWAGVSLGFVASTQYARQAGLLS